MKIVVDSNVVFSAILNTQSKIGQLIINGSRFFNFYSVGLLKNEIEDHSDKILEISGYSREQLKVTYAHILSNISFVDEILLGDSHIKEALDLVSDIDVKDTLFVALNNHLNGKLWTGDKKLVSGLRSKGYKNTITTNELYEQFVERIIITRGRNK